VLYISDLTQELIPGVILGFRIPFLKKDVIPFDKAAVGSSNCMLLTEREKSLELFRGGLEFVLYLEGTGHLATGGGVIRKSHRG
jgi:hypothetical protein